MTIKRDKLGRFVKGNALLWGFKKNHGMNKEENNPMWKGKDVKYFGLHKWVLFHKGKAKICEKCKEYKKMIQWANKSHEYKRDLKDWISLCVPCHRKYDKNRSDIKNKIYRHDFK